MVMAGAVTPGDENAVAVSGGGGWIAATPDDGSHPGRWKPPRTMKATPDDETVVAGSGVPGLLAKPETNSCARPRKAGQQENPKADATDLRVSVSSDDLPGHLFVRPNEARHIQTAFPAFAKRPGTPTPPENVVLPGWLVQQSGTPAPRPKILKRGLAHFHDKKPNTDGIRMAFFSPQDPKSALFWRAFSSWKRKALILGCTAVVGMAALAGVSIQVIEVVAVKQNRMLLVFPAASGTSFSTRFIHSVELCPIEDIYRIDEGGRIVQTGTTFASSKAGLPYRAFGSERFTVENDRFRLSNMHRMIPKLLIWANHAYRNTLVWNGNDIPLYDLAGDTLIEIDVRPMSMMRFLLWKTDSYRENSGQWAVGSRQ
jgi:hypothetical protein